jgi:hypothetical protein
MTVVGIVFTFMCIFLNPLYMLIAGSLIEIYKKLPSYLNYVLAFSIAIAIANREIGVQWSSSNGIGIDDAINYLDFYNNIQTSSYILNFNEVFINIFSGKEPLWFLLAEMSGRISLFDEGFLILVSTLVPVMLFHYSFIKITKYYCFCALVFYFLVPEVFHLLFHLYRSSLALSLIAVGLALTLANNNTNNKLIYLAPLGHLSTVLPAFVLFSQRFVFFNLSLSNKLYGLIFLSIFFFIGLYFMLYLATVIGFEKIVFYLSSDGDIFILSTRHFIYLLLSSYLILITKNKNIYLLSIATLLLIFMPIFLDGLGIFFERILILFTPLLALSLAYEIDGSQFKRLAIISVITANFLYLVSKVNGQLFYQYMSDGQFFNFFSGLLYNFYTYLL